MHIDRHGRLKRARGRRENPSTRRRDRRSERGEGEREEKHTYLGR